jgi:hypothetical protein
MGTANRLVPLGSTYLELLVVDNDDEVPNPYFRDRVREVRAGGAGPFAYVVRGTRKGVLDETARQFDLTPLSISRTRADGSVVTWRLAGMAEALVDGAVPGVIEWEPGANPGRIPVDHAVAPVGIVDLEVRCPDAKLASWLHPDSGLPLRAVDAEPPGPGQIVVGLKDGGQLVLGDVWSGS